MRIHATLDTLAGVLWEDVYRQQQHATDRKHWINSLGLDRYGAFRGLIFLVLVVVAVAQFVAFGAIGILLPVILYAIFGVVNFSVARGVSRGLVKLARAHLAADGNDLRFVTFARFERDLVHPLVGFDGPDIDGKIKNRAWKIPSLRQDEALAEVFFEAIGADGDPALLSRFPSKTPTHVFADMANEFITAYGSYLQRALDRHLHAIFLSAKAFRGAVMRFAQLETTHARVAELTEEIAEYDGSAHLWESLALEPAVKAAIARGIARFQQDESLPRQAMLLSGSADSSKRELAQTIARLAGAAFVPLFPNGSPLDGDDLVRRVRDVFADARRLRTVIFVEESQRVFDAVASLFLAEWDMSGNRRQPWVLAAIASDDKLEPRLRARFGSIVEVPLADSEFVLSETTLAEIHALTEGDTRGILLCGPRGSGRTAVSRTVTLPLPDTVARVQLLRRLLRGKQTEFALDDGIYALAEISEGRGVGDLRALVDQATQRATMRAIESADPTATALRLADFT